MAPTNDPPRPSVDPDKVASWLALANPAAASPAEIVIMNNQIVLAQQNKNIMQSQEAILLVVSRMAKKRGGSVASSVSGATEPTEMTENTEVQEAMSALKAELFNATFDQFQVFISEKKKKLYVTRAAKASGDANEFHEYLVKFFTDVDEAHPALGHLKKLNADLKLDLYAFLGKAKKEKDKSDKDKAKDSGAGKKGKASKKSGAGTAGADATASGEEGEKSATDGNGGSSPVRPTRPRRVAAMAGTKRNASTADLDHYSSSENAARSPRARKKKRISFTESTHGGSSPVSRNVGRD